MKRLKGGKMSHLMVSLVVAAAVFLLRADTASPGTPGSAGPRLPPARIRVPAPQGALGYRVPLVVRQQVPAQIRGGVYMPAHETYVVLRPGYWELQGAAEDPAPAAAVSESIEASEAAKGCWLRRLFRKLGRCDGGS